MQGGPLFLHFWPPLFICAEVQQAFRNVREQKKKRKERELYRACLYFIMCLCGNGRGAPGASLCIWFEIFFFP